MFLSEIKYDPAIHLWTNCIFIEFVARLWLRFPPYFFFLKLCYAKRVEYVFLYTRIES